MPGLQKKKFQFYFQKDLAGGDEPWKEQVFSSWGGASLRFGMELTVLGLSHRATCTVLG